MFLHYTHASFRANRPPLRTCACRFVTEDMLLKSMPKASASSAVLMCGPPVMMDRAVKPNLEKLGFDKAQMLAF